MGDKMTKKQNNARIISLDLLRISSYFLVIMTHVSAQNWYNTNPNTFNWQICNIYDILSKSAVPVLVMISFIIFLEKSKEISLKELYLKYISKLVITYISWCI